MDMEFVLQEWENDTNNTQESYGELLPESDCRQRTRFGGINNNLNYYYLDDSNVIYHSYMGPSGHFQ
jgi:hypothetical protein